MIGEMQDSAFKQTINSSVDSTASQIGSKSITNEIDKEWIDLSRDAYKTKCKKRIITDKVLSL